MGRIKILENVIRHYPWGSVTAIPELLDIPSYGDLPCAELWMGDHPVAPSRINHCGRRVGLDFFISQCPEEVLGSVVTEKFGASLPFLFKVLAAAKPLSLQAHPDRCQAEDGFARENQVGIPLDAPERNYKDSHHKPECLCALTRFSALCGFRALSDIIDDFSAILPAYAKHLTAGLEKQTDSNGLKDFFQRLLIIDRKTVPDIIGRAVDYAGKLTDVDPVCRWVVRLNQIFPNDIMALAPVFLNLIELSPREAMFLPAGVLHSYLEGTGVELMANSDNVLRGGLTSKHVARDELLDILYFSPMVPRIMLPVRRGECEEVYESDAEEFVLSVLRMQPGKVCLPHNQGRVSILLCVSGQALITEQDSGETTELVKGASVIIPASVSGYALTGDALCYKATVPF